MENIKAFFTQRVAGVCENIVVASLILAIGLWLVKLVSKAFGKGKLFRKLDPAARGYLQKVTVVVLRAVVILSAAAYLGVPMASVAAVLGSAGLALGLALQGGLSNIAGGIMLLVTHPFKIGDYVVIGEREGSVESIGIYYTSLITPDGQRVVLPNGTVTGSVITDYSSTGKRRLSLDFSVSYDSDADAVRALLEAAARENGFLLADPEPRVVMSAHGDSAVVFTLRAWADAGDYWDARFSLIEDVKRRFDKENIEIPYPQMDVHIK